MPAIGIIQLTYGDHVNRQLKPELDLVYKELEILISRIRKLDAREYLPTRMDIVLKCFLKNIFFILFFDVSYTPNENTKIISIIIVFMRIIIDYIDCTIQENSMHPDGLPKFKP